MAAGAVVVSEVSDAAIVPGPGPGHEAGAAKVPALVVARLGSSRLPRKPLLEFAGRPMIVHEFDRVLAAHSIDRIVLCTTTNPKDDELAGVANDYGVAVYRGSEADVPRRLLDAMARFDVDFAVIVEADETCVDPVLIDAVVSRWHATRCDVVRTRGIPIGAWILGVSRDALQTVCASHRTEGADGWGALLADGNAFHVETLLGYPGLGVIGEKLRLTLDYPEDLELVRAVYARLYEPDRLFRLPEVVTLLENEPTLSALNAHLTDVYWRRLAVDREVI